MRLTGGHHKNRTLFVPEGKDVRPTSDRMRQSLFNMLQHASWASDFDITTAHVLDLFCGSGSLGLEAISRGAPYCTFIDRDMTAILKNSAFLPSSQVDILRGDLPSSLDHIKTGRMYDLVFMDPPYRKNLIEPVVQALINKQLLNTMAILVTETEKDVRLSLPLDHLDTRVQSQSALHFYRYPAQENQ